MSTMTSLESVGFQLSRLTEGDITSISPIDGRILGRVNSCDQHQVNNAIDQSAAAFRAWRRVPAPRRGELVRLFGEAVRRHKPALAELITLEVGKISSEAAGEVQEVIDICDFAVGLSRQLYGLTIASERPGHHMQERWHPLGPVAIITAFNFPIDRKSTRLNSSHT